MTIYQYHPQYNYPVGRAMVGKELTVLPNNTYVGIRDLVELDQVISTSWGQYFLDIAKVVSSKSKDRTKVGCVLVSPDTKQILSTGFNGFCRGVSDTPERYADREVKMDYVVHAEANAICAAAYNGMRTYGSYAFITLPPCHSCAKLLKQAGITKVFYLKDTTPPPTQEIKDDWRKKQQLSLSILHEAGINTYCCQAINQDNDEELKLLIVRDVDGPGIEHITSKLPKFMLDYFDDVLIRSLYHNPDKDDAWDEVFKVFNTKLKVEDSTTRMLLVRYLNIMLDKVALEEHNHYHPKRRMVVYLESGKLWYTDNYTFHEVIPV